MFKIFLRFAALTSSDSRIGPGRLQAASLADVMGYPVVAELSSSRVQHKTDVGAARLSLSNALAVRTAFSEIVTAARRVVPAGGIGAPPARPVVEIETRVVLAHCPDRSWSESR